MSTSFPKEETRKVTPRTRRKRNTACRFSTIVFRMLPALRSFFMICLRDNRYRMKRGPSSDHSLKYKDGPLKFHDLRARWPSVRRFLSRPFVRVAAPFGGSSFLAKNAVLCKTVAIEGSAKAPGGPPGLQNQCSGEELLGGFDSRALPP